MISYTGSVGDLSTWAVGSAISAIPGTINASVEPVSGTTNVIAVNQVGSDTGYLQIPVPAGSTTNPVRHRAYFNAGSTWASASFGLITMRPTLSTVGAVATISGSGQPGQMRLTRVGGASVVNSPTDTLALNTWYRVELMVVPLASRARVEVFNMGSDEPLWSSGWQTHSDFSSANNHIQVGRVTATPSVTGLRIDNGMILHDALTGVAPEDIPRVGRHPSLDPLVGGGPTGPVESIEFNGDPEGLAFMTGQAITQVPGSINPEAEPGGNVFQISQSGSNTGYLQYPVPTEFKGHAIRQRLYFNVGSSWPGAAYGLVTLRPTLSSQTAVATLSGAGQPGQVRLSGVGGATLASSPLNTIARNTWYRLEFVVSPFHSSAKVSVFPMGSGAALWTSGWIENDNFTPDNNYIQIGRVTNSPAVTGLKLDNGWIVFESEEDVPLEELSVLGREYELDPLPTYTIGVWDGSTLTELADPIARHRVRVLKDGELIEPKVYLLAGSDLFLLNPLSID